jgi:hypothetical protein
MNAALRALCTAFDGHRRIASGSLKEVALAVQVATSRGAAGAILVFDDRSGRLVDIDTRGRPQDVLDRLAASAAAPVEEGSSDLPVAESPRSAAPRGRGRPKLGVVAREVTLLPRHWDWLGAQPGGASVALRKLVEAARRSSGPGDALRRSQEAAYHFMSALAGDLPGYEEATRALFASDRPRLRECISGWPGDVREYTLRMADAP